jgi:hypothetical protein
MSEKVSTVISPHPGAPSNDVRTAWDRFHRVSQSGPPASFCQRLAPFRVVVYFVLGLLCLDGVIYATRATWNAYDPDDYLERLDAYRQRPRDLVLVGGSPMSEGVDPDVLAGLSWHGETLTQPFNLGLPGATTSEIWHAIEHGLTPPRLLVYGLSASDLNDSRREPHGVRSLMDSSDVCDWLRCRSDGRQWLVRHFAEERVGGIWQLYFYRNAIRLWAADQVAAVWPDAFPLALAEVRGNLQYSADIHRGNGFAPQPKLRTLRLDERWAAGEIGPRFHFLENYALGGHLSYLHRILEWGEVHGVAVVLVDMPVPRRLEEELHPQAFALYRTALEQTARERSVPVLWARRSTVGMDDGDFADMIHLNARGTAKLSVWLCNALTVIGR